MTKMMNRQFKQFGVSLIIVLSLFVSSITACGCAHHLEKAAAETLSCHHGEPMAGMENADDSSRAEQVESVVSTDECRCLQPAPKASAKNGTIKVEQQTAIITIVSPAKIVVFKQIVSFKNIQFEPPFYLSDSFHNLSPGRAPPTL